MYDNKVHLKQRNASLPNIHLFKRENEVNAVERQLQEFKISSNCNCDELSVKKSPSFGGQLQEKCKALGSRISSRRKSVFNRHDNKCDSKGKECDVHSQPRTYVRDCSFPNQQPKKNEYESEDAATDCQQNYCYSRPSKSISCNERKASYVNAPETQQACESPLGGAHSNAKSYFDCDSHSNGLSESEEINFNMPFSASYGKQKAHGDQNRKQIEPWENLTFITYPQELLG